MRALATLLATTLVLLAGCSHPVHGERVARSGDGNYHVAQVGIAFQPGEAIVPVGATVVWHNNATVVHDVAGYVGDPVKDDRTQFSSGRDPPEGLGHLMEPGDSFEHTFTEKGTWTIWCHTHHEQGMKQILHVV